MCSMPIANSITHRIQEAHKEMQQENNNTTVDSTIDIPTPNASYSSTNNPLSSSGLSTTTVSTGPSLGSSSNNAIDQAPNDTAHAPNAIADLHVLANTADIEATEKNCSSNSHSHYTDLLLKYDAQAQRLMDVENKLNEMNDKWNDVNILQHTVDTFQSQQHQLISICNLLLTPVLQNPSVMLYL